jgi:hypothetical protein
VVSGQARPGKQQVVAAAVARLADDFGDGDEGKRVAAACDSDGGRSMSWVAGDGARTSAASTGALVLVLLVLLSGARRRLRRGSYLSAGRVLLAALRV